MTKIAISPQRVTDLYEILYGDAKWVLTAVAVNKYKFQKNPRWRMTAILKPLNRHISGTFRPILIKFGTVMHTGSQKLAQS